MILGRISLAQWLTVLLVIAMLACYGSTTSEKLYAYSLPERRVFAPPVLPAMPIKDDSQADPALTAQSVYAVDLTYGMPLYEKAADLPLPPASSIKLLTALTARMLFEPTEIATVGAYGFPDPRQPLRMSQQLTVDELLAALLIQSNNTAAYALANHAQNGLADFIEHMNANAQYFGLKNTFVNNPAGFDDDVSRSSARDLGNLIRISLLDPYINTDIRTQAHLLTTADGMALGEIRNTNQLLGIDPQVVAGKTGTTDEAGQVLVTILNIEGHDVAVVLMGSRIGTGETRLLADWIERQYTWVRPDPFDPTVLLPEQSTTQGSGQVVD